MKKIVVDIGNTAIKVAWAESELDVPAWGRERWLNKQELAGDHFQDLSLPDAPSHWFVTCVNHQKFERLATWIRQSRESDVVRRIQNTDIDLEIDVDFPAQVGTDRLVAASAARQIAAENHPLVIIDSGTATTIDLVLEGSFRGGAILPGIGTMLGSLSQNTDALPDLRDKLKKALAEGMSQRLLGTNTEDAILVGVLQAQLGILKHFIHLHKTKRPEIEIYLTGGGIEVLKNHLPDHVHFVDDLVLRGTWQLSESLRDKI